MKQANCPPAPRKKQASDKSKRFGVSSVFCATLWKIVQARGILVASPSMHGMKQEIDVSSQGVGKGAAEEIMPLISLFESLKNLTLPQTL